MATTALVAVLCTAARADVAINDRATSNMSCAGGVCTATAKKAVLNVGELASMLGSGDVAVKTGDLAKDISVDQPLQWTGASRLTLDAQQSVIVNKPVTVAGQGGLTITYESHSGDNDLYFFGKGQATFADTSSSLIINGQSFTLKADLPSLAKAMNNSNGAFALANDYDSNIAYKHSPIDLFQGTFEGLGHTIRHFELHGGLQERSGMFAELDTSATVRDIYLKQLNVRTGSKTYVGGLVGWNKGTIVNVSVDGRVRGTYQFAEVGGLVGENYFRAAVLRSRSAAAVSTEQGPAPGGLVGVNWGSITQSYATGPVTAPGGGGLVGTNVQYIANSYATGSVSAEQAAGGFATVTYGGIASSYSSGSVHANCAGGFVGDDSAGNQVTAAYWDMDTSGVTDPSQGACNPPNAPGITGLTVAQMKSGLPDGFDPKIWGLNPAINDGYPYLLANPPR